MASDDKLQAGDPCPICGGEFKPDPEQDPDRLIDAKHRNSPNPDAAARYERRALEKVEREGVIHKCVECGYRTRFKTADAAAADAAAEDTARQGRDKARDERDAKAREEREAQERRAHEGEGPEAPAAGSSSGTLPVGRRSTRAGSSA
jgi:hypothetical protein